jgi:hypothetical protein
MFLFLYNPNLKASRQIQTVTNMCATFQDIPSIPNSIKMPNNLIDKTCEGTEHVLDPHCLFSTLVNKTDNVSIT